MEKRIFKSIVWLAAFAPFAASAQMDELADNHAAVPTLLKEYGKSSDVVFQAFELVSKIICRRQTPMATANLMQSLQRTGLLRLCSATKFTKLSQFR